MWLLSPSSKRLMTVVVMFVDNHATVVVARDDAEHFACHSSSVRIKRSANADVRLDCFKSYIKTSGQVKREAREGRSRRKEWGKEGKE